MSKGWTPIRPEEQAVVLDDCPFCHSGETLFLRSESHKYLMIVHWPLKGDNCPARMEQACDSQEMGAKWWNDRSPKNPVVLPEPPDDSEARQRKISKTPPPAKPTVADAKPRQRKLTPREWAIKKLIDP
jgi:hypothetical protein